VSKSFQKRKVQFYKKIQDGEKKKRREEDPDLPLLVPSPSHMTKLKQQSQQASISFQLCDAKQQ
jgi:flagellar basal body rod protein FlgB